MGNVYEVGINDADYTVYRVVDGKQTVCRFYSVWHGMMQRCYSGRYQAYIGCSVDTSWHSFMTFRAWMMTQEHTGKELDKDVQYPGNKVYSPKTCVFVRRAINTLLINTLSRRGAYPQGVYFNKLRQKFLAQLSVDGKQKHIGYFDVAEDAGNAYREAKRLHILRIACCEPDVRVKQGLYRHSLLFNQADTDRS